MRALPAVLAASLLVGCSSTTLDPPDHPSRTSGVAGADEPPASGPAPREVPQGRFTGEGAGCEDLLAYRASSDGTQYVVITADNRRLGLAVGTTRTVDLGEGEAFAEVVVDVYASAVGPGEYCAGAPRPAVARARWRAQAGLLTISTAAGDGPGTYRATLLLERAHFTGPEGGMAVVVPHVVIEDVLLRG